MGATKTSDHIQIKIHMPNPNQEPPASSKAPSQDLKDMDFLCTFKIKIESQRPVMNSKPPSHRQAPPAHPFRPLLLVPPSPVDHPLEEESLPLSPTSARPLTKSREGREDKKGGKTRTSQVTERRDLGNSCTYCN